MRVEVTQEDLDNGWRDSKTRCPVALALRRKKGAMLVEVDGLKALIFRDDKVVDYDLPGRARRFVKQFDRKVPQEPIVFHMRRKNARTRTEDWQQLV